MVSVSVSVTFVYCVETAKDTAIVAMECGEETVPMLSSGPLSMTLEEWSCTFSRWQQSSCFRITVFYGVRAGEQKVGEWGPKIWKI